MPLDAALGTEIKSMIAAAKQRPMSFGYSIAAKAEDDAFLMHRNKSPQALAREAKAQAQSNKLAYGTLSVDGDLVSLTCQETPSGGLAKRTRKLLKLAKLNYKVRIVGPGGEVLEEDAEEDGSNTSQADTREPDPAQERWLAMRSDLDGSVTAFLSAGIGDTGRVRSAWAMATEAADEGDFVTATRIGERLAGSMADTGGATANTAEGKWSAAAATMGPRVSDALAGRTGPSDKIRAVWAFAQGKAQNREFDAALKSLVPLDTLLKEAALATKSEAETAVKTGTVKRRSADLSTASGITSELTALGEQITEAAGLLPPGQVTELGELVSEIRSGASTNDLDQARVSLSKLEYLLQAAERSKPEKAKWEDARDKIDPLVAKALADRGGDSGKIRAVWDFALGKAELADFKTALSALTPLAGLLTTAGGEKDDWEKARDKTQPRVENALAKGLGDVTKIRAVWGFALAKQDAGAFPAAMKALVPLEELLKAAEAATKSEAQTATTPGTVDKARYDAEVLALRTTLEQARKIGGFNDALSQLALGLRQAQTAVQDEVAKPDYAEGLKKHAELAVKVVELLAAKTKYDADKQSWQQKLAPGTATIETVEGCGPVTTKIDALKQPFDAAMLRARAAAADRNFDVAGRELDAALGHAKAYLEAKRVADEGMSRAFAEAREQGALGLAAIPPVPAVGGGAAEGVEAAMGSSSDLGKSKGLQTLLAEAKVIEKLYGEASAQSLRGKTGTVDAVVSAAERAITNCQAYQEEHKATSRSKNDQAKFAQAEALLRRYREIATGLRGLKQTYGAIETGLSGDIAAKGKALGLLQAMAAPPASEAMQEGARHRRREVVADLMKTATTPDQVREIAELVGGELKAQYERQMAAGKLADTIKGSTKAAAHASTKLVNVKRAENVDQSRLLANRLIGPEGQLEIAGLFACGPEGLADKSPAKKHMARTLKKLRDDPEAWAALEAIPAPEPGSTGEKMIRATLGLKPDAKVGPAEARKAALSSLLTDLRQQDVGSCFATQVAIRVHDTQPKSFLTDMAALMKTGALERSVGTATIKIPLEGQMSDAALQTSTIKLQKGPRPQITSSSRGGALDKPAALQDSPAFASVLSQLGIADGGPAINRALTNMQDSKEFKLNQNRKAIKAGIASIADKVVQKAVLTAALAQVTADPGSAQTALTQAMVAQGVAGGEQTNATAAAARTLSALEYDVEPGLIVRQLVMDKVGLDEDAFADLQEFHAKTAQVKRDPRMNRLDEQGGMAKLVSPADDDLKKLMSEVETLDKKIDRTKMQAFETAKQGCYDAFLGDEDNRLLRAWEYTVTALAEAGSLKSTTTSLHAANQATMNDELNTVYADMSNTVDFKKAKVKEEDFFKDAKALVVEYQRLYDDVVRSGYDASTETENASDGNSTRGAHYLYDTQGASGPEQWIKIDDKAKYQVLVRGLVMLSWDNLFGKEKNEGRRKITRDIADKMADKLGSDGFIVAAKQKVQTQTGKPAADPWQLPGGSQPQEVVGLYDEKVVDKRQLGAAANADELLQKLSAQLKTLWDAPRSTLKANTNAEPEVAGVTANILGLHVVTLSVGDPKFKAILESGQPLNTAIDVFKVAETTKWQGAATATPATDLADVRAFCVPVFGKGVGDAIVNDVLTKATALAQPGAPNHDHLARAVKKRLEDNHGLTPEASADWVAKSVFATVVPPIAAADLLAKLKSVAESLGVPDDLIPAVTKRAMTALTGKDPADIKSIKTAVQAAITEEGMDLQVDHEKCMSALREPPGMMIADSNWGDAEHHIKLAMVVNPISGAMETWRMNEDGSGASKMKQDDWAKREWWTVT